GEVHPARQVEVQDVEAARAQPELAPLDVDDDVVAQRDGPGQSRIGDAWVPVHLDAGQTLVPLDDGGDAAAPQANRHLALPPKAATVPQPTPSKSAPEPRSEGVGMSSTPFARLPHCKPRSFKTFASAAPPESPSRTS